MQDPRKMSDQEIENAISEIDEFLDGGNDFPLSDPDPGPYERASDERALLMTELNNRIELNYEPNL